mgnify:FL=1
MSKSKNQEPAGRGSIRPGGESRAVDMTRRGPQTGPNSDPDSLGEADLERRAAAAVRDPAEGPRKKSSD